MYINSKRLYLQVNTRQKVRTNCRTSRVHHDVSQRIEPSHSITDHVHLYAMLSYLMIRATSFPGDDDLDLFVQLLGPLLQLLLARRRRKVVSVDGSLSAR
jgi:hypothetical protein